MLNFVIFRQAGRLAEAGKAGWLRQAGRQAGWLRQAGRQTGWLRQAGKAGRQEGVGIGSPGRQAGKLRQEEVAGRQAGRRAER